MNPVDRLLFQIREEAFAPRVVAGFTNPGKTLLNTIVLQQFLRCRRRILAAAIAMEDAATSYSLVDFTVQLNARHRQTNNIPMRTLN